MRTYRQGDVVRVPFPYTDRNTRQYRPALVISAGPIGDAETLLWVVMITSAANRRWRDDISLETGYAEAGLPAPSVIRPTKIAMIDVAMADRLGEIPSPLLADVMRRVRLTLGEARQG